MYGVLLHAMSDSEPSRVRPESDLQRILPMVAPHPVQPNRQFPGHGHLGNSFSPAHQVQIPTPPVRVTPCRRLCCFSRQETQQRAALRADMPQPLLAGTGVLTRNQPGVAAELLAAGKPLRSPDDQNLDQSGDGSRAWVGHQPYHGGPRRGFLLDGGTELRNLWIPLVQQLP
jgi:hypothetical protein